MQSLLIAPLLLWINVFEYNSSQKEQRMILNAVRSNKACHFWDNLQLHRQSVLVEDSVKVKRL